jgi:hypothetical protein
LLSTIIAEILRKDNEENLKIQGESLRVEGEIMLGQIRAELSGEYVYVFKFINTCL